MGIRAQTEFLAGDLPEDASFMSVLYATMSSKYVADAAAHQVSTPSSSAKEASPPLLEGKYHSSSWYRDVFDFITMHCVPPNLNKTQTAAFQRKCNNYKWENGSLWFN
jgi:hypothetical protein